MSTSAIDATGKEICWVKSSTKPKKKSKSFVSTLGCGGTLDAPASGKLVITVKLTATEEDGKVIELDEFKTTAVIP